jgi:hypothetical protein
MRQLASGISRGNVFANDNFSRERLLIRDSRSVFVPWYRWGSTTSYASGSNSTTKHQAAMLPNGSQSGNLTISLMGRSAQKCLLSLQSVIAASNPTRAPQLYQQIQLRGPSGSGTKEATRPRSISSTIVRMMRFSAGTDTLGARKSSIRGLSVFERLTRNERTECS